MSRTAERLGLFAIGAGVLGLAVMILAPLAELTLVAFGVTDGSRLSGDWPWFARLAGYCFLVGIWLGLAASAVHWWGIFLRAKFGRRV